MTRFAKTADWVVLTLAGAILAALLYGFWAEVLDGRYVNPILEFGARSQQYTHQTLKLEYRPGEMVTARVLFSKNRNIIGEIQWYLINKRMYQYAIRKGSLPVGVWDLKVPVQEIPLDATPGDHWFTGSVRYWPNWIGKVEYPIWTNKFQVVAP